MMGVLNGYGVERYRFGIGVLNERGNCVAQLFARGFGRRGGLPQFLGGLADGAKVVNLF